MDNSLIEIERLFENLKFAWNEGQGELYASYFTDDCDYVAFDGQHLKGKNENAQLHNKLFKSILKGSKLTGEIKTTKFITSDVAIFYAVGAVQLSFQKTAPKNKLSINTNVAIKEHGVWKISSFQNTRIKKPNFFQRLFTK